MCEFHKYSGAGNDFILLDGNTGLTGQQIRQLCDRRTGFRAADGTVGSDGLIILRTSDRYDFEMEFFNPDGTTGMMCGNGGRCVTEFAHFRGITPADGSNYVFAAADGVHTARILSSDGRTSTVRLRMTAPTVPAPVLGGHFVNTGTRHFVLFVDDVEKVDVATEGARLRHDPAFAPEGTNVNFVQRLTDGSLKVRTFEKGVEAETLACGTGVVASALVNQFRSCAGDWNPDAPFVTTVHARVADLEVESAAGEIFLTGPVERIY